MKQLKLSHPVAKFKVPCFRSNLFYDVVFPDVIEDEWKDLVNWMKDALAGENGGCGIVYCRKREDTEMVHTLWI